MPATRRALTEPHKLVLALHMAACVQAELGCLDGALWQRLLSSSHGTSEAAEGVAAAPDAAADGPHGVTSTDFLGLCHLPGFQACCFLLHIAAESLICCL